MANANITSNLELCGEEKQVTGHQLLDQAEDISSHWWSTIDALFEQAKYWQGRDEPLPQWAIDWLERQASYKVRHESYDQHRVLLKMARQALSLAEGNGVNFTYEIWTKRSGHRVDMRHESLESANKVLAEAKGKYPDAFVARVSIKEATGGNDDPALLDTLIGRLQWAGMSVGTGDEEDHFTVIDATGRSVTVPASVLVEHTDVMSRLSDKTRERIESNLKLKKQKQTIRKAAKETAND